MYKITHVSVGSLIFIASTCVVNGVRILGVAPISTYSHYQLGDRLFKGLAARGHELTVITPYAEKTPVKNFKQIVLTGEIEVMKATSTSKGSNEKFDLVITYQYVNEAFKGLCYYYGVPCVLLTPMPVPHWTHTQVGNPYSPAYVPDMYSDSRENTFVDRLKNSLFYVGVRLFYHFYGFPRQNVLLQKYFPGAPHLSDLYYNTSLVLVNSHVSITPAVPHVPNMIEIGGFHADTPKELPQDLKEYLDNAKDGAIFFSMGSILKSKDFSPEKLQGIVRALSGLKQKVLWKWEAETLPGQPPNVKISEWLPQQDILAHPNVKLFITHGGLLSTTEAIYHGVPVLSIPVFGDQGKNAAGAENAGYGLTIPFKEFTGEKFSRALNEILSNPKYSAIARRRSEIMDDEPLKPLDKARFWVEYVIRHQGAPHLRSAALNLNWYQYLLLDVLAVVALGIFVAVYVVIKLIKIVCCKTNFSKINQKKKRN